MEPQVQALRVIHAIAKTDHKQAEQNKLALKAQLLDCDAEARQAFVELAGVQDLNVQSVQLLQEKANKALQNKEVSHE